MRNSVKLTVARPVYPLQPQLLQPPQLPHQGIPVYLCVLGRIKAGGLWNLLNAVRTQLFANVTAAMNRKNVRKARSSVETSVMSGEIVAVLMYLMTHVMTMMRNSVKVTVARPVYPLQPQLLQSQLLQPRQLQTQTISVYLCVQGRIKAG